MSFRRKSAVRGRARHVPLSLGCIGDVTSSRNWRTSPRSNSAAFIRPMKGCVRRTPKRSSVGRLDKPGFPSSTPACVR